MDVEAVVGDDDEEEDEGDEFFDGEKTQFWNRFKGRTETLVPRFVFCASICRARTMN